MPKNPSMLLFAEKADCLCGLKRLKEAAELYQECNRREPELVTAERLRPLAEGLLRAAGGHLFASGQRRRPPPDAWRCARCRGKLVEPVTQACGHSVCKSCAADGSPCGVCGSVRRVDLSTAKPNVLAGRLAARMWPSAERAAALRTAGNACVKEGRLREALAYYDESYSLCKCLKYGHYDQNSLPIFPQFPTTIYF